jgi:hypothetical protein
MDRCKHSLLSCSPSGNHSSLSMECQQHRRHKRKIPLQIAIPRAIGAMPLMGLSSSRDLSHSQKRTFARTLSTDSTGTNQSFSTRSQKPCSTRLHQLSTLLPTATRVPSHPQNSSLFQQKSTKASCCKRSLFPKPTSGLLSSKKRPGCPIIILSWAFPASDTMNDLKPTSIMNISQVFGASREHSPIVPIRFSRVSEARS